MGFVSVNPIVLLLHLKTSSHTWGEDGGGRGEGEGKKLCSLEGTHGHSVCVFTALRARYAPTLPDI